MKMGRVPHFSRTSREVGFHPSRVPHLWRTLPKVGFHNCHSLGPLTQLNARIPQAATAGCPIFGVLCQRWDSTTAIALGLDPVERADPPSRYRRVPHLWRTLPKVGFH